MQISLFQVTFTKTLYAIEFLMIKPKREDTKVYKCFVLAYSPNNKLRIVLFFKDFFEYISKNRKEPIQTTCTSTSSYRISHEE